LAHRLDLGDDGKTVQARTGDLIQIDLPLKDGYADWQLAPPDTSRLEYVYAGRVESVGTSGGSDRFVYRAVSAGRVLLEATQQPSCAGSPCSQSPITYRLTVEIG
jgi:hypothetical protein